MKIRNGFVSNSSSSSFIILGVPSNESSEIVGIDSLYVEGETDYINGYLIADYDVNEGDIGEVNFEKLQEKIKFVSEKLGVDEKEIKLIYGVRPS
jgi:hypothetical protein